MHAAQKNEKKKKFFIAHPYTDLQKMKKISKNKNENSENHLKLVKTEKQ